jgi:hypothetical protein
MPASSIATVVAMLILCFLIMGAGKTALLAVTADP